jgi:hypothetical protein
VSGVGPYIPIPYREEPYLAIPYSYDIPIHVPEIMPQLTVFFAATTPLYNTENVTPERANGPVGVK